MKRIILRDVRSLDASYDEEKKFFWGDPASTQFLDCVHSPELENEALAMASSLAQQGDLWIAVCTVRMSFEGKIEEFALCRDLPAHRFARRYTFFNAKEVMMPEEADLIVKIEEGKYAYEAYLAFSPGSIY